MREKPGAGRLDHKQARRPLQGEPADRVHICRQARGKGAINAGGSTRAVIFTVNGGMVWRNCFARRFVTGRVGGGHRSVFSRYGSRLRQRAIAEF